MALRTLLRQKLSTALRVSADLVSTALLVPTMLRQLFFADNKDAYYTEAEWSGNSHLLKDYSTGVGSLREKRLGYCYDFDGVNDYVNCGKPLSAGTQTQLFACAWISGPAESGTRILDYDNGGSGGTIRGWTLRSVVTGDNTLEFFASPDGDTESYYRVNGSTVILDNAWHHIAVYFNAGAITLYVDGVSQTLTDTGVGTPAGVVNVPDRNFNLGAYDQDPLFRDFFSGKVFDARVYVGSDAATANTNLNGIYNFTYTGTPVAHYPLQEETGTTAYDISGNDHHGTITGAVTSGVGSIHQPDAGVTKSYPNDEGYNAISLLNGSNAYFSSDVGTTLDFGTGNIRISGSFLSTSVNDIYRIVGKVSATTTKTGWQLYVLNTGVLRFIAGSNTGSVSARTFRDSAPISANTRYDFEVFWDSSENTINFTLNGVIANGVYGNQSGAGDNTNNTSALTIGAWVDDTNDRWYFPGWIANININDAFVSSLSPPFIDTANNSPITAINVVTPAIIPAKSSTLAADGTALTYTGRAPQPGLVKDYGWQGNGSTVYVDLGIQTDFAFVTASSFTIEFPLSQVDDTGYIIANVQTAVVSGWAIYKDGNTLYFWRAPSSGGQVSSSKTLLTDGSIAKVRLVFDAGDVSFFFHENGEWVPYGTGTITLVANLDAHLTFLNRMEGDSGATYYSGAIGPVSITTGGITTTYAPIKGTRDVAKLLSSGTGSIITDAVTNGVLADLYTLGDGSWRSPAVENGARWTGVNLMETSQMSDWTPDIRATQATGVLDPLGGNDAIRLTIFEQFGFARITGITGLATGVQYTASVWARRNSGTNDLRVRSTVSLATHMFLGTFNPTSVWERYSFTWVGQADISTGMDLIIQDRDASGFTPVELFGFQINEGATALPYESTNGNPWPVQALVPAAPGATVAANGNAINIPANKHPRSVLVDRTGGIIAPLDYVMETDEYTAETFYEVPTESTIDKRITTNYADRHGAGFTDVSGNSYYSVTQSYHPFATTYLNNVVAADGEALERQVALLYNELILGCIEDDIWEAIKASCVLAGARTLAGCLVPLVGAAPTNINFVTADYNRITGLTGNGVDKYLNTNRNNNVDPSGNHHLSAFATALGSANAAYISSDDSAGAGTSSVLLGSNSKMFTRSRSATGVEHTPLATVGLFAISRAASDEYTARNGTSSVVARTADVPSAKNTFLFRRASVSAIYSAGSISFYSIGEAIDLAKLDARISTLMTKIGQILA